MINHHGGLTAYEESIIDYKVTDDLLLSADMVFEVWFCSLK